MENSRTDIERQNNKKQHSTLPVVEKIPTGITGLDEMLEGGVPKNRTTIVSGFAGLGKTVFLNEFLYRGITKFNEDAIFVTFGEAVDDLIRNVGGFGWDYGSLVKQKKLVFVDFTQIMKDVYVEVSADYDFSALSERIRAAVKKTGAKRLVIDGIDNLFEKFSNKDAIRSTLLNLTHDLTAMGVTSMISAELSGSSGNLTRFGVAEFIADALIELDFEEGEQQFVRTIFVKKYRGASFRSGRVVFEITTKGVSVFPKISFDADPLVTSFDKRTKIGIKGLDDALNGGIPEGHIFLVSGNTGSGKSIMAQHFIETGIRNKEVCVYVALEEPVQQIKKTAAAFGWDFDKYEKEGKLSFITASLMDLNPNRLLYDIVNTVKKANAKRVVIDSISTLQTQTHQKEQVRQFLIQMYGFFKQHGVTVIMTYLSQASFGAEKGQLLGGLSTTDLRLSSVVDGIILLRYVERKQSVSKLITILKMRGISHSKDIFQFEIAADGIKIQDRFND